MRSFKIFNRRVGVIFAAAALVFATALPGIVAAAQLTERSMTLSSSSSAATGVTYNLKFTASDAADADAFVVDFCSNSPLYGENCTPPTGFSMTANGGSVVTTTGFTDEDVVDANTIRVTGDVAAEADIDINITNVKNPDAAGTIYARVMTFDTVANADDYESNPTEPDVNGGLIDSGSVAISITPTVGVSAAVLESMTFCVAAVVLTEDCANAAANPPTLALGEDVGGGVIALTPGTLSTGELYAQISTNADDGAVVRLKSNALSCGGLLRAGAPGTCDIAPALTGGTIAAGQAKFGVLADAAADPVGPGTPSGTFQVASGSSYNDTTYEFNYVGGNATGVTSTYGDAFLDTNGDPVNNRNMLLTFGASISNATPAGKYSTDLSMIATGTF